MKKQLLYESLSGIKSYGFKDTDGKLIVQNQQDVEPVLEGNREKRNNSDGWSKTREMRHIASIPMILVEQWLKEGIDVFNPDHLPAVKRKLRDMEYQKLRISSGRI